MRHTSPSTRPRFVSIHPSTTTITTHRVRPSSQNTSSPPRAAAVRRTRTCRRRRRRYRHSPVCEARSTRFVKVPRRRLLPPTRDLDLDSDDSDAKYRTLVLRAPQTVRRRRRTQLGNDAAVRATSMERGELRSLRCRCGARRIGIGNENDRSDVHGARRGYCRASVLASAHARRRLLRGTAIEPSTN